MSKRLFLDAPNLGDIEKKYLLRAIDAGYVSTVGPFVSRFEERFSRFCRVPRAVSTQSGTAALHVCLYELGVGKGDEVIVPALTFVATVNPILHLGATPVFVDVDPKTWTMDPARVAKALTPRTKAILPVHLYGNPCDMTPLLSLARRHNIAVLEDASESLGATYRGRSTGSLGDFGCFSFNGNKIMTTGGGGMVIGKSRKKLEHVRFLVNQAREESKGYYHPEAGFNFRMTNIEAALGLAQMTRLADFCRKKRRFHAIYRQELGGLPRVRFQEETPNAQSSWWLTCLLVEGTDASDILRRLANKGIPGRRIFYPLPVFPHCAAFARGPFPVATSIFQQGVCLPSSTRNSDDDIRRACAILKKIL